MSHSTIWSWASQQREERLLELLDALREHAERVHETDDARISIETRIEFARLFGLSEHEALRLASAPIRDAKLRRAIADCRAAIAEGHAEGVVAGLKLADAIFLLEHKAHRDRGANQKTRLARQASGAAATRAAKYKKQLDELNRNAAAIRKRHAFSRQKTAELLAQQMKLAPATVYKKIAPAFKD
jgi:hypothetical protein